MTNTTKPKWYENKILIILFFFILPPLGIYGMAKRNSVAWKKVLYIVPASILILFTVIGIMGAIFIDSYKTGIDYYNKKDYVKAYNNFKLIKSDDPNYNDAILKMNEIKPIVDSLQALKLIEKENAKLRKEQKNERLSAKEIKKNDSKTEMQFPQVQQDFIKIIADSEKEYKSAPNELKKSSVRSRRGDLIRMTLGNNRDFNEWVGVVTIMETTSKGNAYFGIKIDETDIKIMTTNNEFSDIFDKTLINQSNPLYDIIAELKKGDKVRVSGLFMNSDNTDYISEASLTENGSMTKPDFIAKFTKIVKQ